MPNVLFISGSVGLGHVTRDLAIASALRKKVPHLDLVWLAGDAARDVVKASGEQPLSNSEHFATGTPVLEAEAGEFSLNLVNPSYVFRRAASLRELLRFLKGVKTNLAIFKEVTSNKRFDLIIGDEIFELMIALTKNPHLKTSPLAIIMDCVGVDAMSRNPLEKLTAYVFNRGWASLLTRVPPLYDLGLFVGEVEDILDAPFGFRLPNRRESAKRALQFPGYILPFEPADYGDKSEIRRNLGYGDEPLVICSIGGTSVGAALLELCAKSHPILRNTLLNLRMVLVCGPRLSPTSFEVPAGVEIRGYVPRLYEHFAASDLAIVQGGGTTTLELTALRRPFIYFPLEKHFEQQLHVAARLRRHKAGVEMRYSETTPSSLAHQVITLMGKDVNWSPIPADGALEAAERLSELLLTSGGPSSNENYPAV
jgi:UDP-N-acetylglucosamine:LPS N-acetylglucosamine transferase